MALAVRAVMTVICKRKLKRFYQLGPSSVLFGQSTALTRLIQPAGTGHKKGADLRYRDGVCIRLPFTHRFAVITWSFNERRNRQTRHTGRADHGPENHGEGIQT